MNEAVWNILYYCWLFFFVIGMIFGITALFVIITRSLVKDKEDENEKDKFEDCGL